MKTPQTKTDLESLIEDKVEESLGLEYKAAKALENIKEIAKDVSAMANSAGGLIIYGIKEFDEKDKKHLPEKIDVIDRKNFSKEWIENVITANISPKINGLKIIPISVDEGVIYVVEIPQSETAHQNTKDKDCRYYKRHNFKAEPMYDYEVRDIFNRVKFPIVELQFEIEVVSSQKFLKIRPFNNGNSYAQFVNYFVEFPADILDLKYEFNKISENISEFYGENTFRDVVDVKMVLSNGDPVFKHGPSRFDPILPKLHGRSEKILLAQYPDLNEREIKWRVHADNAPVQFGSVVLNKIKEKWL